MRLAAAVVILSCIGSAQFKSTVPLVVAPTTVTDAKGRYVDGLTSDDLILYDNNVPQTTHMDWMAYPIDLVVAVQTSANSGAMIDKLDGSGILFTQLLAADAGQTAVISFSDEVKVRQDFTRNPDLVIRALRTLRKDGGSAHMLDALLRALGMLERRPAGRRRVIVMIAEKRDRSSTAKLAEVVEQTQRLNATVYWLTYSPFLEPFTAAAPSDAEPGGLLYALGELVRLQHPDLAGLFAKTTGGRTLGFVKKNALEQVIQTASDEIHRQYVLTFDPAAGEAGKFHAIRVAVKNRPELHASTREGYWTLP